MSNIKEDLKKRKPILGTAMALKGIINSKLSRVYVSSGYNNKNKIINLGKNHKVEVIELQETNKELGNLCKKPYSVSVVSFE